MLFSEAVFDEQLAELNVSEANLFDSLTRLNEISRNINQLISGSAANVDSTLAFIVQSATQVIPNSSAVIYSYDETSKQFDLESRFSYEGVTQAVPDDYPRSDGIGYFAVREKRRIISTEENIDIHPRKVEAGAREMVCYPLMISDEFIGALYVYLHNQRKFTNLELLLLDNFVNQAVITLSLSRERNEGLKSHVRKGKELRRLRRAGTMISSRSSLQETLDTILQYALEVMDAQYGTFRLVDSTGKYLVRQAIAGGTKDTMIEKLPIDAHSVMGRVALEQSPLVISDLREQPWADNYFPLDREVEMRSELAVPLIGASNRIEGVLNLESPHRNAFTKQDRYILQIFATQAVSAIQDARLVNALQEISGRLLTSSQQEMLEFLAEQACDLLNARVGLIWVLESGLLRLTTATDNHLQGDEIPLDSLTGLAAQTGNPVSSVELQQDPRFLRSDLAVQYQWGSALSVPLIVSGENKPRGVFSIYTGEMDLRDFDIEEWDTKVMRTLAHYAALAIKHAANQKALDTAREQQSVTEMFAAFGDVAANLMHRLNNKVGTIPVRVEGIKDKEENLSLTDEYLGRNLDEIKNSAAEAMRIVEESLFHLKPVSFIPVDIGECVLGAIQSVGESDKVHIELDGLNNLPMVLADKTRLTLVFSNLIENAASMMESEGGIRISGRGIGEWVEVRVADTGPGVPAHLHERIFEFRYSGRSKEHPGRLGFGLWWVKTLMVRMKSVILIESDGHSGSTFVLRFPNPEALEN